MKKILILLYILLPLFCNAQKEAYSKFLGNGTWYRFDFNTNPPLAIPSKFNYLLRVYDRTIYSSICKKTGEFLMFIDPELNVYDKNDSLITTLPQYNYWNHTYYYSKSLIVPVGNGNKLKYYIFSILSSSGEYLEDTNSTKSINYRLNYAIVKEKGNSIEIVEKDTKLDEALFHKSIVATKHQNNIDTWLIAADIRNATIKSYLITECGIQAPIISKLNIKHPHYVTNWTISQNMMVSPNGKWLHFPTYTDSYTDSITYILQEFDKSTGKIVGKIKTLPKDNHKYDYLFSPNSKYLYKFGNNNGLGFEYLRYDTEEDTLLNNPEKLNYVYANKVHRGEQFSRFICGTGIYFTNKDSLYKLENASSTDKPFFKGISVVDRGEGWIYSNYLSNFLDPAFQDSIATYTLTEVKPSRVCLGDSTVFNLNYPRAVTKYYWDYGNGVTAINKSNTYKYPKAGKYKVRLVAQYTCTYDTFYVDAYVDSTAYVNLGDTYQCIKNNTILNAGANFISYQWNTKDTLQQLVVNKEGLYAVKVSNTCGSASDSVQIQLIKKDLAINTSRNCIVDSTVFQVTNTYPISNYNWHYGDGVTKNINIFKYKYANAGIYTASLIADYHCFKDTATTQVIVDDTPILNIGDSIVTCSNDAIELNAGAGYVSYVWQDGSKNQNYTATQTGIYSVAVTNTCGTQTDSVSIKKVQLDVPNIITPNNDGLNEALQIKSQLPNPIYLNIVNRWGGEVFNSSNYQNNWDANGLSEGIYYYTSNYEGCEAVKGWVQVVR